MLLISQKYLKSMSVFTHVLFITFMWSLPFSAKSVEVKTSNLIPIEALFDDPQFSSMSLSPDGKLIAAKYREGTSDTLAIMDVELTTVKGSINFGEYRRITRVMWPRSDRFIVGYQKFVGYLDNQSSAEVLVAYDVDGTNGRQLTVPKRSFYRVISMLPDEPNKILVTKTHAFDYLDDGQTKLFTINIENGKEDYIAGEPRGAQSIIADTFGNPRLATAYIEKDDDELGKGMVKLFLKATPTSDWKKVDLDIYQKGASIRLLGFNNDSTIAYITTNVEFGGDSIYAIELATQKSSLIFREDKLNLYGTGPMFNGSIDVAGYMPDYAQYIELSPNSEYKHVVATIMSTFGKGPTETNINTYSFSQDNNIVLFRLHSDVNAGGYYLMNRGLDGSEPNIRFLANVQPGLDEQDMADLIPFKFNARDGVELHGYYMLPTTGEAPYPMVQIVHGGPHGVRDYWGFNKEAQFLANRGYAVVMVNFRGSGGYGDEFLRSGYGHWGSKMIDDKTDATLWMVEQGFADKDRMCIYGGSYGGYGALQSLVREPDLYQCGIGYVGVYDLVEMKKSGDIPERESGRKYLDTAVGTDEEVLKQFSPAYNVEKIKADLFIAHGSQDVRVPMEQYESLSKSLKLIGKPYISMVREEGHGYMNTENRFDFYRQMETFLAQHLQAEVRAQGNLQLHPVTPLPLQAVQSE